MRGTIEWQPPPDSPDLRIVMSTFPDEDLQDHYSSTKFSDQVAASKFHPTVLHVARKIKSRLQYDQIVIPNYSIYEQELHVTGGNVSILNKTSEYDEAEGRSIPRESQIFPVKKSDDGKCRIYLGEEDTKLNVIILKFNTEARSGNDNDQLTLKKMIEKRIKDPGDKEKLMEYFSSKSKTVDNKHKMRIKVDIYNKTTGEILDSSISGTIINTESVRVGAFEIHDVTPRTSCSEGGRKIVMISEFTTSDFLPRFQLWGPYGRIEDSEEASLLQQPVTVNKIQNVVIFISPNQNQANLKCILDKGYQIKLVALRTSDNVESKPFAFNYVPHNSSVTCLNSIDPMPAFCTFCSDIDSPGSVHNGLANMKGSSAPHKRKKTLSGAGPRNKRVLSTSGSSVSSLSPDSGADMASMSPEESSHYQLPELRDFDLGLSPETVTELGDITLDNGIDELREDVLREYDIVPDGRAQNQGESMTREVYCVGNKIKSLLFTLLLAVLMVTVVVLMVCPELFDGDGWYLFMLITTFSGGLMIPYYILILE